MQKNKICTVNASNCNFKLSKPKRSEAPKIEKLLEEAFPHMKRSIPFWMSLIEKNHTLILRDGKEPIGLIDVGTLNGETSLNLIATHPDYQGKGLGSQMLKEAENIGRANFPRKTMILHTEASKLENLYFYEKNGWKVVEIDPFGYKHSASVKYSKKLDK